MYTFCNHFISTRVQSSFAAQSVAEAIGTQSVKVKLVRMCLCLVGTHESMFSCMNLSVFYWCVF